LGTLTSKPSHHTNAIPGHFIIQYLEYLVIQLQGCLWNWYEGLDLPDDVCDSYRALVPDTLHGIYLGIWLYLVNGIRDWAKGQFTRQLAVMKLRTVDARLRGMPRESGFRLPRRKGVYMEKKKTYKGYEQRNMMQVSWTAWLSTFRNVFFASKSVDPCHQAKEKGGWGLRRSATTNQEVSPDRLRLLLRALLDADHTRIYL
jgi:hypothetical protein